MLNRFNLNKIILVTGVFLFLSFVSDSVTNGQYLYKENNDITGLEINLNSEKENNPDSKFTFMGKPVPITGNVGQLKYFFEALNKAKVDKIRIAHFGDSLIMGDVISGNLRENLQAKFGGTGVGFLSIDSDDIKMRKSSSQDVSDDWEEASIFKRNPHGWPFGINASVFVPANNSWVKYETTRFSKAPKSFDMVRLFYADGNNTKIKYSFNNGKSETETLTGSKAVNEVVMESKGAKSIKIDVLNAKQTYFFGVSLEDGNGIYLDNFPIKGNSGVSLDDIPKDVLQGFDRLMNYKLIIISFGINVLSPTHENYKWYEKRMIKVINYFKDAFPNTSILLISMGDKAIKRGSRFITDPGIPSLLEAQENVAKKTDIAFWNLYEAMGGKNAIVSWVNAGPPLAFRDYTHLTYEGGEVVADLLTESLMKEYAKYK